MKKTYLDSSVLIAAAIALKADEFITGEKPGKPLFKIRNLTVIGLEQ